MSTNRHFLRDKFTFSLRGMTATASFFITPVVADDRINKAWDEKFQDRASEKTAENVSAELIYQQS